MRTFLILRNSLPGSKTLEQQGGDAILSAEAHSVLLDSTVSTISQPETALYNTNTASGRFKGALLRHQS